MEGPSDIDYKGIGEGLSTGLLRDSSPSGSTISLGDTWQTLSPHKETPCEPHSDTSTAKPTVGSELESESYECLSVASIQGTRLTPPTNNDYSQQSLTPLERYCCDVQPYEQLVMGQLEGRPFFLRLNELDNSLGAAAKLLGGFTAQVSASSWSIISSSGGDINMTPALELDNLILMSDSPEWQAVPQDEQAKHLHRIARLRRRIRAEGGPRKMKSVRVRKRSKNSNMSNETTGA